MTDMVLIEEAWRQYHQIRSTGPLAAAVIALHEPTNYDEEDWPAVCVRCTIGPAYISEAEEWPCETVQALIRNT